MLGGGIWHEEEHRAIQKSQVNTVRYASTITMKKYYLSKMSAGGVELVCIVLMQIKLALDLLKMEKKIQKYWL